MIESFKCRDTEDLFKGKRTPRFVNIKRLALRKLNQLHIATPLVDLRIPPNNRLEPLHGDREGQWIIRVNDQWRVCFQFANGVAYDVECGLSLR